MNTSLVLASLLSLALVAPFAGAESDTYGPVVGVSVLGPGAASGANQAVITAGTAFLTATVTVVDDLGANTYFSACVERGNLPNVCSSTDGDLQATGFGTVTLTSPTQLPAGTTLTVFVYTLAVGGQGQVGVGTTGTATATFS